MTDAIALGSHAPGTYMQAAAARRSVDGAITMTARMPDRDRRLRCASVLKPLLFWAGSDLCGWPDEYWAERAAAGIAVSDNDATVELWQTVGGARLLAAVAERTGQQWPIESGGVRSFGRVLIRADEVALAYLSLLEAATAGDDVAGRVSAWMRTVSDAQSFGTTTALAAELGLDRDQISAKAGWFSDADEVVLRTHLVVAPDAEPPVVAAVLTAIELSAPDRADYTESYTTGAEVLEIHQRYAGSLLVGTVIDLLRPTIR